MYEVELKFQVSDAAALERDLRGLAERRSYLELLLAQRPPPCGMDGGVVLEPGVPGFPPGAS